MAADPWKIYDSFGRSAGEAKLDLSTHSLRLALFTSSHSPLRTDDSYDDLTGEVADGDGYTTGGYLLTGTWTESGGVCTLDFNNLTVVPSGSGFAFRYGIIYDDSSTNNQLIAMCLVDNTPADIVTGLYDLTFSFSDLGVLLLNNTTW